MKQKQKQLVLDWFARHKELTTRQAVTELGIMSLPKRIEELRHDGYPIAMSYRTSGTGARYGVYTMETEVE